MGLKIFDKFDKYLNQIEKNNIKKIKDKLETKNEDIANSISIEIIKILESKMIRILEEKNIFCRSDEKQAKFLFMKIRYLYAQEKKLESAFIQDTQIPQLIYSTFEYIRNWRNDEGHASKYEIKRSFSDVLHLIKGFNNVLSFLINFFDNVDFELTDIDENELYDLWEMRRHFLDELAEKNKKLDTASIKLEKVNLRDLILNQEVNFFIPSYQRKYSWSSEVCSELVDNIINKIERIDDDYFGTIAITIEEKTKNDKVRTLRLIDGQQRITTSLIIFRAIYDVWKYKNTNSFEEDYIEIPEELENTFFKVGCSKKYKNDTGNEFDNRALEVILNDNSDQINRISQITNLEVQSKSLAASNYNLVYNKLNALSQNEVLSFYNRYAYRFLISCVDFNKTPAEEMEIFETLNSTGTELTTFDMIKNFLFNLVEKNVFLEEETKIVLIFNEYLSFDNDDLANEFLHSFCEYKLLNFGQAENNLTTKKKSILQHFKKIYNDKNNIDLNEFTKIVSEIGKYACIAKSFSTGSYSTNSKDILFPLRKSVANVSHKDVTISVLYYIIDIYAKNKWDSFSKTANYLDKIELMEEFLFQFEKWYVTLLQVNGTGQSLSKNILKLLRFLNFYDTSNYVIQQQLPKEVKKWLSMESPDSYTFQNNEQRKLLLENSEYKMPTKEQFYFSLLNNKVQDSNIEMILLRRLENQLMPNLQIIRNKNSIEHIVPKKIQNIKRTNWLNYLNEEFDNKLSEQEIVDKHSEYVDKLGNLMLLDLNKENAKVSNLPFETKRNFYKTINNPHANLIFNQDKNVCDTLRFGFAEIDIRTKIIAEVLINNVYFK
ncbi:hypothetical protein CG006_01720 [Mesoplasma florum]|uniref:DUF262 domain-containing protein n=1 Tax=Mesoplasma florum TaxID=2151 RepID=UPI000D048011|nr:DUF262 domain-containing protein [Mesoplasma florum]AVN63695.1 hypothetical protein CG006_01720 [Mesoplasma florum]